MDALANQILEKRQAFAFDEARGKSYGSVIGECPPLVDAIPDVERVFIERNTYEDNDMCIMVINNPFLGGSAFATPAVRAWIDKINHANGNNWFHRGLRAWKNASLKASIDQFVSEWNRLHEWCPCTEWDNGCKIQGILPNKRRKIKN